MGLASDFKVKICNSRKRSEGAVLLTLGRNTRSIRKTSEFEAIVAINRDGEIFWQKETDFSLMDCRLSRCNTLLVMATDGRAMELALDGEIICQWYCKSRFPGGHEGIALDTMKLHHVLGEIQDGDIMSLSIEHRPLDKPEEGWSSFMGDTVVLFNRQGNITNEYSLADVLDPQRFA